MPPAAQMLFTEKNATFQMMNRAAVKTNLFGESLQKQVTSSFTLSERFYSPFFRTPSHTHENALFCLVVNGSYTETYDNRSVLCSPSDFLFHAGEFPHAEQYYANGGHAFIVEIEKTWLKQIRDRIDFPKHSVDYRNGILPRLGAKLYREFRRFDLLSPVIIEGLMLEIAGETARQTFEKKNAAPLWLSRAENYLRERFNENLSLDEIAGFVRIHPVHLAQSFRKYRQTTVGKYLREIRLENARKDLLAAKKTLCEIALENGFADQSHFSRLFKEKFGITPKQYRSRY